METKSTWSRVEDERFEYVLELLLGGVLLTLSRGLNKSSVVNKSGALLCGPTATEPKKNEPCLVPMAGFDG